MPYFCDNPNCPQHIMVDSGVTLVLPDPNHPGRQVCRSRVPYEVSMSTPDDWRRDPPTCRSRRFYLCDTCHSAVEFLAYRRQAAEAEKRRLTELYLRRRQGTEQMEA